MQLGRQLLVLYQQLGVDYHTPLFALLPAPPRQVGEAQRQTA